MSDCRYPTTSSSLGVLAAISSYAQYVVSPIGNIKNNGEANRVWNHDIYSIEYNQLL